MRQRDVVVWLAVLALHAAPKAADAARQHNAAARTPAAAGSHLIRQEHATPTLVAASPMSVSQPHRGLVPADGEDPAGGGAIQQPAAGHEEQEEEEEEDDDNEPPAWLEEYAQWHRQNRGAPNVTYVLFYCGHLQDKCTGLGDRVRSSMMLLRLANLYRKVLLLSWDYPDPLSRYLAPNKVDWRYTDDLRQQLHHLNSSFDCGVSLSHNDLLHALFLEGQYQDEFRQAKVVKMQLVRDFHHHIAGEPILHMDEDRQRYLQLGRHLFNFLFTPTDEVARAAERVMRSVYPDAPAGGGTWPPYVAWHWRTGGLVDEPILNRAATTKVEGASRLHQLLAALHCARNMTAGDLGQGNSGTGPLPPPLGQRPMLLVTDHNILRRWVAEGELAHVVTPPLTVVHSRSKDATSEDVLASWVDMTLLARATCLITCHSGFSWAALFMSNSSCWMEMRTCLHKQHGRFKGFDVRRRQQRRQRRRQHLLLL